MPSIKVTELKSHFEPRSTNRARGAQSMTPAEVDAARRALGSAATRATVQSTLAGASKAGGLTAAVGGMLAILKHGLDYAEDRIDRAELLRRTAVDVGAAGLTGGGIAAVLTGIATTAPVLAVPAAVAAASLTVVGVIYIGTEAADLGGRWIELVREHQSGARSRPTVARPRGGPEALEAAAPPDQAALELRASRERSKGPSTTRSPNLKPAGRRAPHWDDPGALAKLTNIVYRLIAPRFRGLKLCR